ncbi:snoRNP complex protein nop56 [Orobanche hederae]
MEDKRLKLIENRRRIEDQYKKYRVCRRQSGLTPRKTKQIILEYHLNQGTIRKASAPQDGFGRTTQPLTENSYLRAATATETKSYKLVAGKVKETKAFQWAVAKWSIKKSTGEKIATLNLKVEELTIVKGIECTIKIIAEALAKSSAPPSSDIYGTPASPPSDTPAPPPSDNSGTAAPPPSDNSRTTAPPPFDNSGTAAPTTPLIIYCSTNSSSAPQVAQTSKVAKTFWNEYQQYGARMVFLFEFALGYALFDAHGANQLPKITTYKIAEEYLDNDPFKLIAYCPFSSPREALFQMKAILNSTVTKKLKSFLVSKLPKRIPGASLVYQLAVSDGLLAHNIFEATEINVISGALITQVIRGLWMKIDKLIVGLKDGLVYVRGLTNHFANTVEERSNDITIPGNDSFRKNYRMVVGIVDVILADIVHPEKVDHLQAHQ